MEEQSLMTRKDVLKELKFKSIKKIVKMEKEGALHPIRFGRSVRYDPQEVAKLKKEGV